MNSSVTIVIPTYNRPNELIRSLKFLKIMGNRHPVIVVDGSTLENQKANFKIVESFTDFVTLKQYAPDYHPGLRMADALNQAKTKYSVISADDDFILPSGLTQSAQFLEENPDYVGALGKFICLGYTNRIKGGIYFLDHLKHIYDLKQDYFLHRHLFLLMLTIIGCSPMYFAVRRTDVAKAIYDKIGPSMRLTGMEAISNTLTLARGKVRALPVLFGIRDYSNATIRDELREGPKSYHVQEDLTYIRSLLLPIIMEREGLSLDRANFVADHFLNVSVWKNMIPEVNWVGKGLVNNKNWYKFLYKCQLLVNLLSPSLGSWITGIDRSVISALKKSFQ